MANDFKVYFEFCEGNQNVGIRQRVGEVMSLTEFNQILSEEVASSLIFKDMLRDNIKKYIIGDQIQKLMNDKKFFKVENMEDVYKCLENWYNEEVAKDYSKYGLGWSQEHDYMVRMLDTGLEDKYSLPVFIGYDKAYFEIQLNGETIDGGRGRFDIGDDCKDFDLRKNSVFAYEYLRDDIVPTFWGYFSNIDDAELNDLVEELKVAVEKCDLSKVDIGALEEKADMLFEATYVDAKEKFAALDKYRQDLGFDERCAVAVLSNDGKALTFYFDDKDHNSEGKVWNINKGYGSKPWGGALKEGHYNFSVVEFDKSFADYHGLETTSHMFLGCPEIIEFKGLENLNTENVHEMNSMFNGCCKVKSLKGIESWDTSKVKGTFGMFEYCRSLKELDLSSWDVSKVENAAFMFADCENLEKLNLSGWSFEKINNPDKCMHMFYQCDSLVGKEKLEKQFSEPFDGKDVKAKLNDTVRNADRGSDKSAPAKERER